MVVDASRARGQEGQTGGRPLDLGSLPPPLSLSLSQRLKNSRHASERRYAVGITCLVEISTRHAMLHALDRGNDGIDPKEMVDPVVRRRGG